MDQIVAHKGVWCKLVRHGYRGKRFYSPETGQRETSLVRKKLYIPLADIDDPALQVAMVDQEGTLLDEERKEKARIRAREIERCKAKTRCRHRIKSHNLRQMMTCTYKENMQDFDRVRRDWKAFVRVLAKVVKGFRAVWGFERQDRGAWHVHAAIDKLPPWLIDKKGNRVRSFKFVRAMWVRITGTWEGAENGTVNFDGHNKTKLGTPAKWTREQSLAQIAGYIAKYLTKDYGEGLAGRNMWGSSQHMDTGKVDVFELPEMPWWQAIDLAFELREGERIAAHRVDRFGHFWCLHTEPLDSDDGIRQPRLVQGLVAA